MIKCYTGFWCLFISFSVWGQNVLLSGRVLSADQLPVAFAAVSLLKLPDSTFIKGAATDESGIFKIDHVMPGAYLLKIQSLGFQDFYTKPIEVKNNDTEIFLDTITITESVVRIRQVDVFVEKPFMQQHADKRVYQIEKNITATGGNASDVLQNIPSVTMDAEGNISLRGSENVNILINGRPATLGGGDKAQLLQQIPASSIVSIEVITNPSSKYDAEGSSGIINIITKRNEKENISGSAGVHFIIYNKAGFNGNLNYKNKHYSIGGSYSINYNPRFFEGYSFRKNIFADTVFSSEQINDGDRIPLSHNARLNAEYYIRNSTTLGAVFAVAHEKTKSPEVIIFRNYNGNNELESEKHRDITNDMLSVNYDGALNLKHKFKKPGNELTADASYSRNYRDEHLFFDDHFVMINYIRGTYPYRFVQINTNSGFTDQYIVQTDYTHNFSKKSKLETGVKSSVRKITGTYALNHLDTLTGSYLPDSVNGWSRFKYTEQVYAAYASYAGMLKELGYQFGLRAEQTVIDGSGQSIIVADASVNRKYLNVFPTAFLSYTFAKQHQLQWSYSMRISRPWFRQLLPFVEVSDPFNLRVGNPNLNPEIFHSAEISWNKTFATDHFIAVSFYYRQTNNNIGRIRRINDEGIATVTFENLNRQYSYGSELILRNQFFKWWDMTTSFNGYQAFVNANNITPGMSNSGYSFSVKNNMNFRFWKDAAFQISTNYNAPMPTAQGSMIHVWFMDVALKKEALKKKATITVNAQDIFFTRRFGFVQEQPNFMQDFWRRRESRVVTLSFLYRFGTSENWSSRRKGKGGAPQQDMEREMIDF